MLEYGYIDLKDVVKILIQEREMIKKMIPNREQAFELLKKYNKSEALINHAMAVEAVMKHFAELLKEDNWPDEYIRAVVSHGWKICSDTEPLHIMEKVLYTIDELTGLINAACLMRPSKSILDLSVSSVKKKFKQKSFAAGVDRQLIEEGARMLNMELDEVIKETIEGMKSVAEEIGLKGSL